MSPGLPQPRIQVRPAPGPTTGVVLLLPGGRATSQRRSSPRQLTALRMRPFGWALRPFRRRGTAVWTLRYRVRGWNAAQASPLPDTRWALAEVRRRHGGVPVVLVGHSMGGRAALRCADDTSVRAVVALAPWLPEGEPVTDAGERSVLLAHGRRDRVTDPRASEAYAARARREGGHNVRFVELPDGHALLRHPRGWHRLVRTFVGDSLHNEPPRGPERMPYQETQGASQVPAQD